MIPAVVPERGIVKHHDRRRNRTKRPECRQLQSDQKVCSAGSAVPPVRAAIMRSSAGRFASDNNSCRELARTSGSIATASPQRSPPPSACEACPPPEGQLVGGAIERAIASFHRMDGEAVADRAVADGERRQRHAVMSLSKRMSTPSARDFRFEHGRDRRRASVASSLVLSARKVEHQRQDTHKSVNSQPSCDHAQLPSVWG